MAWSERRPARAILWSGLAALALTLSLVAPAAAHGTSTPTYKAVLSPIAAAAGSSPAATITLTQLVEDDWGHGKELGSVLISPPSGVVVTGASAVRGATALPVAIVSGSVKVENIDLHHVGQTAVVTIQTTIACGASGSSAWTVVGHNTDAYGNPYAKLLKQDPSSVLSATISPCSLAFVAGRQPSAAATGATITSAPGDPGGPTIQVQLRDGNGAPASQAGIGVTLTIKAGTGSAGAGLGGTASDATDANGRADFAPTIDLAGHGYKLVAGAGGSIGSATSAAFDVDDVAKVCSGACSGTDSLGDTTATVSATSNGGVLTLSLGLDSDRLQQRRESLLRQRRPKSVSLNVTPGRGPDDDHDQARSGFGDEVVPEVRGLLQLADVELRQQVRQRRSRPATPVSCRACLELRQALRRSVRRRQVVRPARQRVRAVQRPDRRPARQDLARTSAHRRPWRAEGPVQICPSCGEENPARFRLCGFCGTPLAAAVPAQEIRKTVTIVFSDLKGSTDLGERLDSESLREVMTRYFDAMRAELERHGGTIEKYIGDAIMAVFGLPTVHEDDALRAVRAAAGMQRALAELNDELDRIWGVRLANRTGVNTGEVVAGDPTGGQRLVTGDPVNTAARLEQAAPTNEILIGDLTYRLVRDAVDVEPVEPLELKGKAERVAGVAVAGRPRACGSSRCRSTRSDGRPRAGDGPAPGGVPRGRRRPRPRMVTIIGDAGVGKSRLIREFLASVQEDAYIVRGRCLSYGRGITFWPLVEIVRHAAGHRRGRSARARAWPSSSVSSATQRVGRSDRFGDRPDRRRPFPLAEVFWAVQRLVEILAERGPARARVRRHPLGRADPARAHRAPRRRRPRHAGLLICARPGTSCSRTARPGAMADDERDRARPARRRPRPERSWRRLLGRSGIAASIRARVTPAAEGNPLFVEQLVSMLVDEGTLRRVEGDWRLADEIGEIRMPPTIHALLAARLDRLGRDERAVVEPASVIGLVFQESAVRWLAPEPSSRRIAGHLAALDRKQLVHPTAAMLDDDIELRFHHILIRDAAYDGLLKRARAILHERFVEWADARNADADRELEFEEILGYHLEQAHRYLAELGPLDEHGDAISAIRASERLAGGRPTSLRPRATCPRPPTCFVGPPWPCREGDPTAAGAAHRGR